MGIPIPIIDNSADLGVPLPPYERRMKLVAVSCPAAELTIEPVGQGDDFKVRLGIYVKHFSRQELADVAATFQHAVEELDL